MFKKRPSKPETGSVQDVVSRESKKFYRLYKSHVLSKITLTIIGIGFAGFSGWSMYQDKQKNGKGQTISRLSVSMVKWVLARLQATVSLLPALYVKHGITRTQKRS